MQGMAVVQHHPADGDRGDRLAGAREDALDHLRRRNLVVRLAGHVLVRQDRLAMRAVDVAQAAVLLVDVVERDPRRHHVIARITPKVGVVLMVGLGAADLRRLHEDLVGGQFHGRADHRFQQRPQPGIEHQRPKIGVTGIGAADLAWRAGAGCAPVEQVVARLGGRCALQVPVANLLGQRRHSRHALRGEYAFHHGPAAFPIAPLRLRPVLLLIVQPFILPSRAPGSAGTRSGR